MSSTNVTRLRTRKPSGTPSWPLILLAGESKTGKSYLAAQFTGDERVGRSLWLDLGEGCADEYGAVPGANYEILEHNGTWVDIINQVAAAKAVAAEALAAGEPPVCLVIDSMTAEWAMLSAWTDQRARRSNTNRAALEKNADAEIDITANYWNDANSRHNRLMNILKTFPGIVVMTALETEKTQFGPGGKPVQGAPKVARPDAQKRLAADATAWIRLSLDSPPVVVGIRSLKHNITPGVDDPEPWRDFTLAALVFEFMGIDGGKAQVRDVPTLNADQVAPGEEPSEDPETAAKRAQVDRAARAAVGAALALTDAKTAVELAHHKAANSDVLRFVAEDARELLGVTPDTEAVTYAELGGRVARYIKKHGRSPAAALAGEPADGPTGEVQAAPTAA